MSNGPAKTLRALAERVVSVCARAHSNGLADEDTFTMWAETVLNLGETSQAMEVAETATKTFPASCDVWLQRIKLIVRQQALRQLIPQPAKRGKLTAYSFLTDDVCNLGRQKKAAVPEQDVQALFSQALDSVPAQSSLSIRAYLIEQSLASHVPFEVVVTHFKVFQPNTRIMSSYFSP